MKSTASSKSSGRRSILIAAACLVGAVVIALFLANRTGDHRQTQRANDGPNSPSDAGQGGLARTSAAANRRRPAGPAAAGQSSDEAIIAKKVMPHILEATRKFIEANIAADQTALNAAERAKNPWLYQRLGLSKDTEEQALAVIRKKAACEQRAMEAASLTNEDDAAFAGLKPYQDELDAELNGLLGRQSETYRKLADTYAQVTRINARLPEEAKLADNQAHRLADLMNDVYTQSAQSVYTPPGEEEDYDDLMQRTAAAGASIRQRARQFLTPEQVDTVIAPPAK